MFFLDQKYPNLTKTFWTTQTEDLIQIKTIGFCDLIQIQNPCFFWTTHFQDSIQSDGQSSIRLLLINWPQIWIIINQNPKIKYL